jgi:hypothetical protein
VVSAQSSYYRQCKSQEQLRSVQFTTATLFSSGTLPVEDELPRTLEFNQGNDSVDSTTCPKGLSEEFDMLPRAFSEKDLAVPVTFEAIEFQFKKDTPEELSTVYVSNLHADRAKVIEDRLQSIN